MDQQDLVGPMDIVKGIPKVIERVPAIVRAIRATRSESENDSMPLFFERTVARHGSNVAIYYEDRVITYDEFNRQANKIAHYLQRASARATPSVSTCTTGRSSSSAWWGSPRAARARR